MSRRQVVGGLCSCSALALAACGSTEAPGKMAPGFRPQLDTDEGGLWQVMDKAEADIRVSRALVRNPELDDYLHGIVAKLVPEHARDIRIYVLRNPTFNASAAPNGMLQVWTGLLLRTQNEAQLAAVLGHELGHYLQRHSLLRLRDAEAKSSFGAFLSVGFGAAGALASLPLLASLYGFSRDQEREADRIGFELMTKAGYRPIEVAHLWEEIILEEKADKNRNEPSFFFATHPGAEERAVTLREMAMRGNPEAGETFAARYQAHIKPIRAMLLEDELRLAHYERTLVLLQTMSAAWPPDGELAYFTGEVYRLRGDEGDRKLAFASYDRALALGNYPPELFRSEGLLQLKSGERDLAHASFRKYLELRPDASDGNMIRSYL